MGSIMSKLKRIYFFVNLYFVFKVNSSMSCICTVFQYIASVYYNIICDFVFFFCSDSKNLSSDNERYFAEYNFYYYREVGKWHL